MSEKTRLLLTSGEPAGVGPELCIKMAQYAHAAPFAVIGNETQFRAIISSLHLPVTLRMVTMDDVWTQEKNTLNLIDLSLNAPAQLGKLNRENASAVVDMLQMAHDTAFAQRVGAIVTAPVHKGVMNEAGIPFTGHTEFFAAASGQLPVIMLLSCEALKVALLTTHLPLRKVADAISEEKLCTTLRLFHQELRTKFGIKKPCIAVLGLNPHAGEDGHMGDEEIRIISPALKQLEAEGLEIIGPLSADTAFTETMRDRYDAVLAMYHDQGLPVLKTLGFHQSANITLGLPYIRTSVDHGTALDLAGTGAADEQSLLYAMKQAIRMMRLSAK